MRPFIGLTCTHDDDGHPVVRPAYVAALHRAGAIPVALPFVAGEDEAGAILERLDGVVFSGGFDIDPLLWGEARHPATVLMHPARQATDLAFARAVLRRPLPALGICGGMQVLNVAAGGSLHQHVPDVTSEVEHADGEPRRFHPVRTADGSRVAGLLGPELRVNTLHHQAVARLGAGLVASAWSPDGLVEALEDPSRSFLVGVQWHPERMTGDPLQEGLFGALAAAARGPG